MTIVRPSLRPRATSTCRSVATRCFVPRSRGLPSVRQRQLSADAAAVDDDDRWRRHRSLDAALDAVAGVADHLVDGGVERRPGCAACGS